MPIYEFKCDDCEGVFESLCKLGGQVDLICPHCGSRRLRKLFSTFAARSSSKGEESVGESSSSPCATCTAKTCDTCEL